MLINYFQSFTRYSLLWAKIQAKLIDKRNIEKKNGRQLNDHAV